MFVELLPEWTHLPLAWFSFLVPALGVAAGGWWLGKKLVYFLRDDRSAEND